MLALLGDIHGVPRALEVAVARALALGCMGLIQLGDFGVYPSRLAGFVDVARRSPIPIWFIDGNHEHYPMVTPWWDQLEQSGESVYHVVRDRLMYVRRGSVLQIDGRRIAFLGGAGSIDYAYRRRGRDWFDEEQIRDADVARLIGPADMLLTHTPPQRVIDKHFDTTPERKARIRAMFGARPDWFDPSARKVDEAWRRLGHPMLYCGHMHTTLQDLDLGCRILNIEELVTV